MFHHDFLSQPHFRRLKSSKRQRGQGMSEYMIIVALIAVASIGVVGYFGDSVKNQMAGLAQEVAGNSGATARGAASTQATAAETLAGAPERLNDYTGQNSQR